MKKSIKSETELINDIMWAHIAAMSHEVRTPTTLITGLSEYMITQDANMLSQEQLKHLDSIHKSSLRLLEAFDHFITLSRITLLSKTNQLTEINLTEICKEVGLSSVEKNEVQAIPHIVSDRHFLIEILEIILSLPYAKVEPNVNLNISQNETQVLLQLIVGHNKEVIFGANDPRLYSCQIGIKNLGGQLDWEEPENGKLILHITFPIFKPNFLSSEEHTVQ